MDNIQLEQRGGVSVTRFRGVADELNCQGHFHVEHWRGGELIGTYDFANGVTNQGKNKLLDVMFHGVTAINTWYIALIDGSGSPTLGAADTYGQINGTNGWSEFVAYAEATRQEWTEGAASNQSITNASPVVFNINGSGSVYGPALVGGGTAPTTKGDAAGGGTLWATAAFNSGTVAVSAGDQLKVTYTVND